MKVQLSLKSTPRGIRHFSPFLKDPIKLCKFLVEKEFIVRCVTCTMADWTSGIYNRDRVGQGAPDKVTGNVFRQLYSVAGGELVAGLPVDTGRGAAASRRGQGWIRNTGGGSFKSGALMKVEGASAVYRASGDVWTCYSRDKGATDYHAPSSA